jgi:formylglycine-generating enzyme required for sulfatase activity
MKVQKIVWGVCLLLAAPAGAAWPGDPAPCKADAVKAGSVCVDKYEASVWEIPNPTTSNKSLVKKVQKGTVTLSDLTAGGATQRGLGEVDDYPCADNGQNCADKIFAVSIAGVKPSANITWFQAQEACSNARKRLPSNAEWQAAANGSPDPGGDNDSTDCNTTDDGFPANDPVNTGSRSSCVSARGAYDMVGNVWEWVADWVPLSSACPGWFAFSNDTQCFAGAETGGGPGALTRGGGLFNGTNAGPFAVAGNDQPFESFFDLGFRCAR